MIGESINRVLLLGVVEGAPSTQVHAGLRVTDARVRTPRMVLDAATGGTRVRISPVHQVVAIHDGATAEAASRLSACRAGQSVLVAGSLSPAGPGRRSVVHAALVFPI